MENLEIIFNKTSRAWAEIDLDAIASNVRILKQWLPAVKIMAVVKADGYGHGLVPTAQACVLGGAEMLGIAAVEEGIALRQTGITLPLVLVCPVCPQDAAAILAADLIPSVGDSALLHALSREGASHNVRPKIYLELDTGMGRSGVCSTDAEQLWRETWEANVEVVGLSTHFANADSSDTTYSQAQIAGFALTQSHLESLRFTKFHERSLAASHGMLRFGAAGGTVVRPGLMIYGIVPQIGVETPAGLRSALTLKARIATVRDLPTGHNISYGLTHRLRRNSRVATVLIGYSDGYPRRLSNLGSMLVHGRHASVLGRVSMDQTVVDVTEIPDAAAGDEAVCIGTQGKETITVTEIARSIETIEHEILTAFSPRVHRLYSPVLLGRTIATEQAS